MSDIYDVGDKLVLRAEMRDSNGDLAVGGTVTCLVKHPDGTVEALSGIQNPSTGIYEKEFVFDDDGDYWVRWSSAGSNVYNAIEKKYPVRTRRVPDPS